MTQAMLDEMQEERRDDANVGGAQFVWETDQVPGGHQLARSQGPRPGPSVATSTDWELLTRRPGRSFAHVARDRA